MKIAVATFLLLCSLAGEANAGWITKTEEDVFSGKDSVTMIGLISSSQALIVDCKPDGKVKINFAEKGDSGEKLSALTFRLVLKLDSNSPIEFTARADQRNDTFMQIGSDERDTIERFVKELRDAKKRLLIGLEEKITDSKQSWTTDLSGSTAAAKKFLSACSFGR